MAARIALFLPRFSRYGGAEGFGLRLATALAEKGHNVTFICARQEIPAPPGVTVQTVGRRGLTRAGKMLWFARRCEKLRPRFDLTIGLGKTWGEDIVRVGGAPLRGFWQLSDQAWPPGPARLGKQLRRRCSPANRLALAMERAQYTRARRIIAVSDLVKELILRHHPRLAPDKVSVVYNEPDPERFNKSRPLDAPPVRRLLGLGDKGSSDAGLLLGFAGANFRLKGLAPLIRALALLPEDAQLVVAGGRNPYKYAAIARKLGLETRVHFLGKVQDMAGFYHALDVFALPSFYDACANAVLEALACGVPAVSSTANGSSVVLPPEQVVQPSTAPEHLARALMHAFTTPPPGGLEWPEHTRRGIGPCLELVDQLLAGS